MTESEIADVIKKHIGATILVAMGPILFLLVIGFFEPAARQAIPLVSPLVTIGAIAYLLKKVLSEMGQNP